MMTAETVYRETMLMRMRREQDAYERVQQFLQMAEHVIQATSPSLALKICALKAEATQRAAKAKRDADANRHLTRSDR
jgi:hypothetical protein